VCDCVIGVLSLPLFRLRLNHATQKQKRARALYFLFAFVLACVHFGVLSLQMQNADVALSRETTDFIMFLYYFICLPVVLIIFKIFIFFYNYTYNFCYFNVFTFPSSLLLISLQKSLFLIS